MATKLLTRVQARRALGDMPSRTFDRLVSGGIPREGDGEAARFPWPECWHWYLKRERSAAKEELRQSLPQPAGMDLAESGMREAAAKAALKELELAERRGEVVPVVDSIERMADVFGRVRSKLLNGPRQVALRVTGTTIPEREGQARGVFDEIMAELEAGDDLPGGEDA